MSTVAAPELPDQRLGLLFACAHPVVEERTRAPLILQLVLGLDVRAIASAFLVAPGTMRQRLVRAKNKIRKAGIPARVPEREELAGRLATVLDAVYAAFAESSTNPGGADVTCRESSGKAMILARLITELMPEEPEALGLLALMLHAEARRGARLTAQGDYVPLAEQDVSLWEVATIGEAESQLHRARALGAMGRFQLEAAIQSAHVHRRLSGTNNWEQLLTLYDALLALSGSPGVAINRALAVAEVHGVAAALTLLDELAGDARLNKFQPYWAARADLLMRASRADEARRAYDIAIGLERDSGVRRFLQVRRGA